MKRRANRTREPGDAVTVLQRYQRSDGHGEFCERPDEWVEKRVPAEVHYVRRRGDYQIVVDEVRYWVNADDTVRGYRHAGSARVLS